MANPTPAEQAAADKAAADAKAKATTVASVSPVPPASSTSGPAVVVPPAPKVFPLTSADQFLLKDTNNDGIPDIIVVVHVDAEAEAKAKAEAAKYAPYYKAIADARLAAAAANAGKAALEVTAAENVAEAKAKADYKGPVPPAVAEAEKAKAEADAKTAADKAALEAEMAKLSAK